MSSGLLQRPGPASDSLLTDEAYRGRTLNQRAPRRAPAPPITMEASQSFEIRFGSEGSFQFDQEPPKWLMPLLTRICELGDLPSGWDSYGAKPIDPETTAFAVSLLMQILSAEDPQPAVVPTSRGGVLLEWHDGGIDLEVDVRSPSSIQMYFEDGAIQEEFENAQIEVVQGRLNVLRDRLQRATGNG